MLCVTTFVTENKNEQDQVKCIAKKLREWKNVEGKKRIVHVRKETELSKIDMQRTTKHKQRKTEKITREEEKKKVKRKTFQISVCFEGCFHT